MILADCGPGCSVQVAARLRAAVALAGASRALTASAGVASYPTNGSDLETLVRAADEALLVSKRTGRNRTTAATTDAAGLPRGSPGLARVGVPAEFQGAKSPAHRACGPLIDG